MVDFKDKQSLFYDEVDKIINNDRISHAYLIETNNFEYGNEIVLEFVKMIFKHYAADSKEYDKISTLIDNNTFSDLIIIEPDGAFIKKEQVLDIKEKFKTTSLENRPRIYIIKNADKLNKYAANSLLKFLEEPDSNVIAIITADNRYKVIETIASRCQVLTLLNNNGIERIEVSEELDKIIRVFEEKKEKSIAFLPITLENDLRNKEFWENIFTDMIYLYENAIRKKENLDYIDYGDILDIIVNSNSLQNLLKKVSILFTYLNNLEYNLNITMMLDKFIIDFAGGEV